jgi:hypothetical protein
MRADGIEESTMPKKDTAATVAAMLSSAGAQTRRAPEFAESVAPVAAAPVASVPPAPASVTVTEPAPATVSTLPTQVAPAAAGVPDVPRTLRLQSATAQRLRDAWLQAKRDDVLLTAQDFASALVDEALTRRDRSRVINRG